MLVFNSQTKQLTKEAVRAPQDHEVVWIRLLKPEPHEVKHVLEDLFHCHPLLVEDSIKLNQRAKLDKYKDNYFLSFFAVEHIHKTVEMGIIIGANYVITIYHQDIPFLETVYEEMFRIEGRIRYAGDILYHILDRCVDEYMDAINQLDVKIDQLERNIYRNPYVKVAPEIYRHKRSMHKLRNIFAEERMILNSISHPSFPYTRQEADVYFIDIYDHISRVIDSLDIYRESVNSLLEIQMNMKSDRMNEIMKTLTVISSFFLPLTFIVGVYGMNFGAMPELNWRFGYLYVWIIMVVVIVAMLLYYRKKKWF